MNGMTGEDGPEGIAIVAARPGKGRVIELDRALTEAALEEFSEEGRVGALGSCCRIRLKPEAPSPCSCSVTMGDLALDIVSNSAASPSSKENRILALSTPAEVCARRFPVLLFFGIDRFEEQRGTLRS